MSTKVLSIAFVGLLLLSTIPPTPMAHNTSSTAVVLDERGMFSGFLVGEQPDVWNQTPWPSIAVPNGFSYDSVIDYSDVGVLINNLSEESKTIGWAFVAARNISLDRVFVFNQSGTPTGETINRNQFNTYFATPFLEMLQNGSSVNNLNYLVTTKGIPLRVSGGNDKASFDQELSLLGGAYNSTIGSNYWGTHDYGPLAGKTMEPFTRTKYGFFLVTRLTGYTVETALDLIERANQSLGEQGTFVLDLATNRNNSGYKFWNDDLYTANTSLNSMGLPVLFDEETEFITNVSNVMGYASWGSNDGNWNQNYLPNSGFDTLDAAWQSGSRYWNHTSPTVAPEDAFSWTYQTDTKQGGNGAFEVNLRTDCDQDGGKGMQGIYGEYFDNDGVSFSSASMPSLIDRQPDRIQIEPHLNRGASNNAYPGLDDRFKQHWGARFSGLIDVPYAGNWTFFINSDDGSELWVNGESLATNYGMHGMRERSGFLNLSQGLHEFRIEFFQGGGPHGLIFSWQGPNTSKSAVPSSAFYVATDEAPKASNLVHRWSFEDGSGASAIDDGSGQANLSLDGMDSSNWRTCPDGSCLWFDGNDDVASVNVDDGDGNLTVSQWVWANTTSPANYASTFAISNQAGTNTTFQHMISGQQWQLHNNQSKTFGDVIAQRWTHLVTVFDDGDLRQYMDGVLVNEDTYPSGSFTNVDLFKLGVNRAGSAYFEGMIDEVLVWDVALEDHDITALRRTIIDNCTSYSGAGVGVAMLETSFTVPNDLMNHAWNIYVYGQREGEVNGAFSINVNGLDSAGNLISTNTSNTKTFTTSWTSQTMRMRPAAHATQLTIQVLLDIEATSTVGSLFVDSVVLRAIRPHMDWVNGSIADTAVSTGGRSFNWGTSYGQSLIADLIEDGASGAKGYVYEPYLTAVGLPSTFLPVYASGFNLAESHAAANLYTGWMGVVVGDPKMAPYVSTLHDVNVVAVRSVGHVNLGEETTIEVMVENLGMAPSNGTLEIRGVLGNALLNQTAVTLPAGDTVGSRATVNVTIVPASSGYLDLRVRYVNNTPERNFGNNLQSISVIVNAPPVIEDVYCSASSLSRGGYTICTVEAIDDGGVTNASLAWQIIPLNETLNETAWNLLQLGSVSDTRWETSLVIPADAVLGAVVLRATVIDQQMMSVIMTVSNVTQVVDAPPTWFGPHASGVDSPAWNNASFLPNKPANGLMRHEPTTLTACVMDADYRLATSEPRFMTNRGMLGNVSYVPQSAAHLYCYTATLALEQGSDLDDVKLEVRTDAGSLLLQRTLRVADQSPALTVQVEALNGTLLDRVVGDGEERIRISVSDVDDPNTSFIGDLTLQWPGGEPIQLPLDIAEGESEAVIELNQLMVPLEGGELLLTASGRGKHGATASVSLSVPFLLTPPTIVLFEACDDEGTVRNMTFGQVATLIVAVETDRPLQAASAQLAQTGWAINAPAIESPTWEVAPQSCNYTSFQNDLQLFYFRLKLDNSLVDGDGRAIFSVSDLDGLVKSEALDLLFQHAPTSIDEVAFSPAKPGSDLFVNFSISDLDGLDQVACAYNLYAEDGRLLTQAVVAGGQEGVFSNVLRFQYPVPLGLANSTLTANLTCLDELQQAFSSSASGTVGPAEACEGCHDGGESTSEPSTQGSESFNLLPFGLVGLALALVVLTTVLRRRTANTGDGAWGEDEFNPMHNTEELFELEGESDVFEEESERPAPSSEETADSKQAGTSIVPDGWTVEAFTAWLDGPVPDGWTDEQWTTYVEDSKATLSHATPASEG